MNDLELLEFYKEKVDDIPELRYCLAYPEEDAVKVLSYLIDNHSKNDNTKMLVGQCMKITKGQSNPSFILKIIEEWKNTT